MRTFGIATMVAIGAVIAAPTAHADLIAFGGGTGSITFTSNGNGTLSFSTAGFTGGTNSATFQSPNGTTVDTGSYTLGSMTGTTGTVSGNIFPIVTGGTEAFTFTGATDSLSGTVTWPDIKDGTNTPQFDVNAVLTITAVSGSTLFKNDFALGSKDPIDFTISLGGGTTLEALAMETSGNTTTGSASSGELDAKPVPEPASLMLFGTALAGLGLVRRRRRKAA